MDPECPSASRGYDEERWESVILSEEQRRLLRVALCRAWPGQKAQRDRGQGHGMAGVWGGVAGPEAAQEALGAVWLGS